MRSAIFFAGAYGLALALTMLKVGAPYRWLGWKLSGSKPDTEPTTGWFEVLVNCIACTSFWVALAMSIALFSPIGATEFAGWRRWVGHAVDGMASCGVSWFAFVVLNRLGQMKDPSEL